MEGVGGAWHLSGLLPAPSKCALGQGLVSGLDVLATVGVEAGPAEIWHSDSCWHFLLFFHTFFSLYI